MNNRTKRIKVSLTRDSANTLDDISEDASMTPSQIINTLLINSDANDVMEKYNANKANQT